MKKHLLLFLIACCTLFTAKAFTHTVIVKGQITDSSGHAVANKTVRIYNNDSTNAGCLLSHTVTTNPNGYYTDTLTCNADIRKVLIVVENCNGERILRDATVNSGSNVVEVNVKICVAISNVSCKAFFRDSATASGIKFTSQGSTAPAGDSIISRTWNFGDTSQPLTGNRVDPTHAYAKPGVYNVCLSIKTKNGCENKYCATVTIKDTLPPAPCKAQFQYSVKDSVLSVNGSSATAPAGDSIISRTWTFGDSTAAITGNRIDPKHTYAKPGVYNVCLSIKTKKGCESQYCTTVTIKDSSFKPTGCKAAFTYTYKDSVVYFNSSASYAPPGDSIISRTWYYIDSTVTGGSLVLQGNVVDTFIRYATPGSYTVYLVIKTKKGCESKTAVTVVIPPKNNECTLQAKIAIAEKVTARKIRFTSSQSVAPGDSIIVRKWVFGDGTALDGNEISPLKEYKDTGVYNVCVTIKTKKGCEKQVCLTLSIRDSIPPVPAQCKAVFSFTISNRTVQFNSAASSGTTATDSIVSRTWLFGDSSAPVTNKVDPSHTYAKNGSYNVYLYIKTKSDCENKYAAVVTIGQPDCKVNAQFTAVRVSPKKIQFNSIASNSANGDSIISRKWTFGDGTVLEGNVVSPVKEYPLLGIYNACLKVKTAAGCEAQVCKEVRVQDSSNIPESTVNFVKVVSINPNPVVSRMLATVWSRNSNTEAEITIIDLYGVPKLTIRKTLAQGNNIIEIQVGNLYRGPYFLAVSAKGSKDSKMFYKL